MQNRLKKGLCYFRICCTASVFTVSAAAKSESVITMLNQVTTAQTTAVESVDFTPHSDRSTTVMDPSSVNEPLIAERPNETTKYLESKFTSSAVGIVTTEENTQNPSPALFIRMTKDCCSNFIWQK
ncbi:MAG TPA: hypothetical protein GX717_08950 [Clostridiaceae bacterium]|nr:hypothetical protein [Clostridiaceae bacterium]